MFRTVTPGCPAGSVPPGTVRLAGLTLPGLANAHSHAFHRALRGVTEGGKGTFWSWRELMYQVAGLTPASYLELARAVYAEMALAGVTCVGEFHYVHHGPGGVPYADPNEMGRALIQAAADAGIRITLLDTCYLAGGLTTAGARSPAGGPAVALQRRGRRPVGGPGQPARRRRARGDRRARPGRRGHPLRPRGATRPDAPGGGLVPGLRGPAARASVRAAGRERRLRRRLRRHPGPGSRRGRGARAAQHDGARHPPQPPGRRAARGEPRLCLPVPDHGGVPGRRDRAGGGAGRGGLPAVARQRQPCRHRPAAGGAPGGTGRAAAHRAARPFHRRRPGRGGQRRRARLPGLAGRRRDRPRGHRRPGHRLPGHAAASGRTSAGGRAGMAGAPRPGGGRRRGSAGGERPARRRVEGGRPGRAAHSRQ